MPFPRSAIGLTIVTYFTLFGQANADDTPASFYANTTYSNAAQSAAVPANYTAVFTNTEYSLNAPNYQGVSTLTSYDVQACADRCTASQGCLSFNIFFERVPSVTPTSSVPNPPSTVIIRCARWKSDITNVTNFNTGQYNQQFKLAYAGSNGYTLQNTSTSPGNNAGFRKTPVLGYNTYNDFACTLNETDVQNRMASLKSKGYVDLGYSMFQIDCGWQATQRQSNGSITYDTSRFPSGIGALSKQAISMGFQWGMYTDEGVYSCDTTVFDRVGSKGYEVQDALQFAGWNVVYMKVDNCYVNGKDNAPHTPDSGLVSRYTTMWNALNSVGINGMLICEWGVPWPAANGSLEGPAQWSPSISTSFRVSDDIQGGWFSVIRIMNQAIHVNLIGLSGNGHYADMDLLEVGHNYMSADEEASHFAIWAMFKSALMISANVAKISDTAAAVLQNKDLIAINQDAALRPVTLVQRYPDHDLFAGPLANDDRAVLLLDQSGSSNTLSFNFSKLGISSATVKNLWTGQTTQGASSWSGSVNAHGSAPLRLSNIKTAAASNPSITWVSATSGTVSGGAVVQGCSGCSNGHNVGYITSEGGSVTLTGIRTSQETQDVLIDYVNCDVAFGFQTQYPNARGASITVNSQPPVDIAFPLSGYDWDTDLYKNFTVQLSGFNTNGDNTIVITGYSGVSYYGPNFDRLGFASA